jgi:hypothetical protein
VLGNPSLAGPQRFKNSVRRDAVKALHPPAWGIATWKRAELLFGIAIPRTQKATSCNAGHSRSILWH